MVFAVILAQLIFPIFMPQEVSPIDILVMVLILISEWLQGRSIMSPAKYQRLSKHAAAALLIAEIIHN